MAFLAKRLFGSTEAKSADQTLELFKQVFGTNTSATGESITWKTALQVSTVLACARIIANGISQVPFKVMLEAADGKSRNPAPEHPLYRVLHRKPNPWQTSFAYRQTVGLHLALCNNHFSFKNVVNGKVVELIPLEPGSVSVERLPDGELKYTVAFVESGVRQEIPAAAIWHIRGLSWNGWMGMEAVALAREAIGLAMTTEKEQARLFKNGVRPSGVLSVDGTLAESAYKGMRKLIAENYGGDNNGTPMILDRNAKWLSQALSGIDAQHLETRAFQVEEVCRAMGVMPFMVGHSDKTATFASAEQVSINHVVHTLAPYYECIEQSADTELLSIRDQERGYYTKFVTEGLLRGSIKDTAEVLDKYVNGGLITANEARSKLDFNPDPDPASDKLRVPANIVGKDAAQSEDPPAPSGADQQAAP